MLKLEEKFSKELYLVGQELYDLLEYNRSLFGLILNRILHRPYYIREVKKDLFKLVSKIERHVIYRLRNTHQGNEHLTISDMENLLNDTISLQNRVNKEARNFSMFSFMIRPYQHWLWILRAKTEIYLKLKKNTYQLNSDFNSFIKMIDNIALEHESTRKHVLPYWLRFFDWILTDNYYKELANYLESIKKFELPDSIPSIYHLLIKKHFLEKALERYTDAYEDEYPVLFSNFQMTLEAIEQIQREINDPSNHLKHLSERIEHYLHENDLAKVFKSPQEITYIISQAYEREQAFSKNQTFSITKNQRFKKSKKESQSPKRKLIPSIKFFNSN